MIKTYIKHHILDKFINTVFDGLINVFAVKKPININVGDNFSVLLEDVSCDSYTATTTYTNVNVLEVGNQTIAISAEHVATHYKPNDQCSLAYIWTELTYDGVTNPSDYSCAFRTELYDSYSYMKNKDFILKIRVDTKNNKYFVDKDFIIVAS